MRVVRSPIRANLEPMTWAAHLLLALLSLLATGSPQGGPHERDRGVDVTLHELRVDAQHPHAVHPTELAVTHAIALPQHAMNAPVDLDDELVRSDVEVADERPERMLPPHPHPELPAGKCATRAPRSRWEPCASRERKGRAKTAKGPRVCACPPPAKVS